MQLQRKVEGRYTSSLFSAWKKKTTGVGQNAML
jgi:hypothetical protein